MTERSPLRKGAILFLTWTHFLNDSYASFLSPVLPLLVKKLELSLALAGTLAATSSVVSALFQPIFGIIADRLKRRYFILLGPALTSLGMSALGLAPSYTLLLLCLIVGGIGVAAFHPQATAAAGQVSGNRKGFGLSLFIFGGSLGFAVGPLAITVLASTWGLEKSYLAVIPGLVSVAISTRFLPWQEEQTLRRRYGEGRLAPFLQQARPLALLYGIVVLRDHVRMSMTSFLPLLMTTAGYSLLVGGFTISLFSLSGAVGGVIGGYISDRWGRKEMLLVSSALVAPFFLGFFYTEGVWAFILLMLGSLCIQSANSVVIAYAQELVPEQTSTVSSLVMGFGWGMAALALPLTGSLADTYGIAPTLKLLSLLPLVGMGLALALPKTVTVSKKEEKVRL